MKFQFEYLRELVEFLNLLIERAVSVESGRNPKIYTEDERYYVEIT